jgi:lipopolysaccharide transport system ATP-binding protein
MRWFYPWRHATVDELVVLDDFFPNLITGFRVAEFNAYIEAFANVRVLSALREFDAEYSRYAARYPRFANQVVRFTPEVMGRPRLAYLMFLNNAVNFLPLLEERGVPFVMTLYPGGGFGLDEPASDEKLARVLSSPLLQTLITTQRITDRYVRNFASRNQLKLPPMRQILGVVVNPLYFDVDLPLHRPYFGEGKAVLDVCFVAEKYMPHGENKGYPEFIAAALSLKDEPAVRFHVVGSFNASDIDVTPLGDRIQFHGRVETVRLPLFFADMDVVVSPNKPRVLHPGNFDGFPTGSCTEAALCGVALVASDTLDQNPGYLDGEAIVIVQPTAKAVEVALRELLAHPARIGQIARLGQSLTRQWCAPDVQIGGRREVIESVARDVSLTLPPR